MPTETIEKERLLVNVKQGNTMQPSLLFCDKIEHIHNHLMFYCKENLIFKVWLRNKKYVDINEALKYVGMEMRQLDF